MTAHFEGSPTPPSLELLRRKTKFQPAAGWDGVRTVLKDLSRKGIEKAMASESRSMILLLYVPRTVVLITLRIRPENNIETEIYKLAGRVP